MTPKISIIIPCYNMGAYLQETLDSVTSYPNPDDYEIIIVNDGSTDQYTIELLKNLEEQGFFVLNQVNMGLSKARNNGIKLAKGEYILPLDADNKIRHNYISKSIKLFHNEPSIDIVYGNHYRFEEEDRIMITKDFYFPILCCENFIDACAVYRKSIWEKVNGYDEHMLMGFEDWEFWLRVALQGARFHHLNEVTFDYRVRKKSMITETYHNYDIILNYMMNKKELSIVKQVKESYLEANNAKHLRNSMEYRIGKLLFKPFRLLQTNK